MNPPTHFSHVKAAALLAVVAWTTNVPATAVDAAGASSMQTQAANASPGEVLQSVYTGLLSANMNYEGHKAGALKELRDAGAMLGVALQGTELNEKKPQEESDAQLEFGRESLTQLAARVTDQYGPAMREHLDNAVRQLTLGLKVVAVEPDATVLPITVSAQDSAALQMAYRILAPGNSNYHGQRVGAMDKIELAASLAGISLAGEPGGNEDQKKSDSRLLLASRYLEQARSNLTTEEQKPMLKFIDAALNCLSQGLEYRARVDSGKSGA